MWSAISGSGSQYSYCLQRAAWTVFKWGLWSSLGPQSTNGDMCAAGMGCQLMARQQIFCPRVPSRLIWLWSHPTRQPVHSVLLNTHWSKCRHNHSSKLTLTHTHTGPRLIISDGYTAQPGVLSKTPSCISCTLCCFLKNTVILGWEISDAGRWGPLWQKMPVTRNFSLFFCVWKNCSPVTS